MGTRYTDEEKAQALTRMFLKERLIVISQDMGIPVGTLKNWRYRQAANGGVAEVAPLKKEKIGDLLLDYLTATLETMTEQASKAFNDPEWLRSQNAADLAILHGVMADKVFVLLEAMTAYNESEQGQELI